MSFDDQSASTEEALPISLYHFVYGPGANDYYAYTDHIAPYTYNSVVYAPISIGRSNIEVDGNNLLADFFVDILPEADIVEYMANRTPTQQIRLTIRQGHIDDPDAEFIVVWSGFAVGVERKGVFARIGGKVLSGFLERPIIKRRYQRGCPWVLYGPGCRAVRRLRATASPIRVGVNAIVLPDSWNGTDVTKEKFLGGYLSWIGSGSGGSHVRTILDINHDADANEDTLILQGSTDGLGTSTQISFFAGCNHQPDDCRSLHDNILNYGGQWYIPLENPVGVSNKFF